MLDFIHLWVQVHRYTIFNLTKTRTIAYNQWDAFFAQATEEDLHLCYDRMVDWENRLGASLLARGQIYSSIEVRAQLQEVEDMLRLEDAV